MEFKFKRVIWSDEEVDILLENVKKEQILSLLDEKYHKKEVYSIIAGKLKEAGFLRTPEQINIKMKNLKKEFFQMKRNNMTPGAKKTKCQFYSGLNDIFGDEQTLESIEESVLSNRASSEHNSYESTSENKIKRVIWSNEEVESMLENFKEEQILSLFDGRYHKKEVYSLIAEKMKKSGFRRTPEQINIKMKNLKKEFLQTKRYNMIPDTKKIKCEFYSELNEIYGRGHALISKEDSIQSSRSSSECHLDDFQYENPENRIKRVIWSNEEVEVMLKNIREDQILTLLDNKKYRKREVYIFIAEKMKDAGFLRTPEQIHIKMKNLKKEFFQAKRSNLIPGTQRMECEFYSDLNYIFGSRDMLELKEDNVEDRTKNEPILSDKPSLIYRKKAKRVIWSNDEIDFMLKIIKEDQSLLRGSNSKKKYVYFFIAKKMKKAGFIRTPEQIYIKVKSLRKHFLQAKKNNMIAGAKRMECEFYNDLDAIFGSKYVIVSANVDQNSVALCLDDASMDQACDPLETYSEQQPPPKRLRRAAIEELLNVGEKLIEKNHAFWTKEFEKQRAHEIKLQEEFRTDMKNIFQNMALILCERDAPEYETSNSD